MLNVIRSVGVELVKSVLCGSDGGCLSSRNGRSMFFTGPAPHLDKLDDNSIKELPAEVSLPEFTTCEELALHRFIYTNSECGAIIQCNRRNAVASYERNAASTGAPGAVRVFDDACHFINSTGSLSPSGAVFFRSDKIVVWSATLEQCLEQLMSMEQELLRRFVAA